MPRYFLSRLIEEAHRNEGFVSAFVYGPQGIGKTSYCLHVAADVYGSWKEALRHLYFDPTNAIDAMLERIEVLERGETEERIKTAIMDDAGVWLSKSSWWEESKQEFGELFDLIRSACSCVIFNSPGDNIVGRIANEIMFRIKVTKISAEMHETLRGMGYKVDPKRHRVAVIYSHNLTPMFRSYVKKVAYDVFPVHYPVHEEYKRIRLKFVRGKLESVKAALAAKRAERLVVEGKINEDIITEQILELLEMGLPKVRIAKILGISTRTLYERLKRVSRNLSAPHEPPRSSQASSKQAY